MTTSPERFEVGDHFTPLVVAAVGQDPVAVRGSDGRDHLIYELSVLNCAARPASVVSVTAHADGPGGDVVAELAPGTVVDWTLLVGEFGGDPRPIREIPPGGTIVVIMDAVLPAEVRPTRLVHDVRAEFGPLKPGQAAFAENFPAQIRQLGGVVPVDPRTPVVIGPPLDGGSWWAANGLGSMNPHRAAIIPVGGRLNPAERYAIDWVRVDPDAVAVFDPVTGLASTFSGPVDANSSYYTWDQPLLAVADGEVVTVLDGLPDAPPQAIMSGLSLDQLGGNHVVLRIGEDCYAFYAHVRRGSISVAVGDRVRKGQEVGRCGNSGSSTESHLHFHVMNSPHPLDADNLPYVLDRFRLDGTITTDGIVADGSERRGELPFVNSVVSF